MRADSMYLTITRREIRPITDSQVGNKAFRDALTRVTQSPREFTCLFAQYVQFNSVFGGGVANLAGEIARRQDIFRDSDESIAILADRSSDLAGRVFFAAIDEFGRKKTHRSMAQDTLREMIRFFGITSGEAKQLCSSRAETTEATREVMDGYCLNRAVTEADLFFGIGFHIGSELLADIEFNLLDSYLKRNYPALVDYLEQAKAYSWVAVHTSVESDHFDAALESANCALSFYTGDVSKAHVLILKGLKHFAETQTRLMNSLATIRGAHQAVFDIGQLAGA